ncbi:MAG: tubulin-like doman-containing protein, partial [Acidobacteriota bacterium]
DVFRNRQSWQHIHSWLHPQVEQFGAEIADGAGGVRAVGRLTYFFHFAKTINPRLSGALQGVGSFHAINDTQAFFHNRGLGAPDFLPQPTPQVFLVTSLAGGTGCGTFLDVLFHLRALSQHGGVPIERIVAILFMPNVFYSNAADEVARRSYANAYAALKELEYYTLRVADPAQELSIDFDVEWEPGAPQIIQGPPFAIANILEARNEDTILLQPSNRSELFSVVAESLFLDFIPGPFPDAKRSAYSNVSQYLAGHEGANASSDNVELPQNFARRYASFGMSKIEIPIDPIKGACAARLGEEIATYINRAGHDTQIQESVRGDMAQRKFDGEGILGRFSDGYKGNIRTRIANLANQAILKTPAEVDRLGAALEAEARALIASDGTDPARWGSAVSAIRGETGDVTSHLNKDVLEWIKASLEDDVRGLKSLIKKEGYLYFLTRFMEDLYSPPGQNQTAYYDARLAKAKQDQEFWRKERQKVQAELKMAVSSRGLKLLLRNEWVVDTLKERLRNAAEQFCLAGADDCLLREAKDVAAKGVDFANQQRPRLQKMADAVEATIVDFRDKCKDLLNVSQQVLLIRFFDPQEDWPKFYTLAGTSVSPRVEYGRFLTQIPLDPGQPPVKLWDLAREISREGATALIRKLHLYSEARFWRDFDAHPRDADVLTHPEMAGQWQMKIDSLVRNAMPLARRGATMVGRTLQVRRMAFLGVAALTGEPYARFIQEIRNRLAARGFSNHDIIVQDTGKPWEVYLYVVTYAFPLPALTAVTADCQDAYNKFYGDLVANRVQQQRHQIPLHLSSRWEGKFDDLVVYTDRA